MIDTIPCRNCDHPLKSGSCLGCNVFRLYEALVKGKLNWAKDEYNGIVESKLEQPTLSPDDVRGVGEWEDAGKNMLINLENAREQYSVLGYPHRTESKRLCSVCRKITLVDASIEYKYCPHCGAKMKGD